MNDHNAKAILRKYRLCLLGVFMVFVILAVIWSDNLTVYCLVVSAAGISIKGFGAIFHRRFISSILTDELNLPKYIDVICTAKIASSHLLEHVSIAYYSGDYDKVIHICKSKLEEEKYEKLHHYYLLMLARSYFEIGDLENLRAVNEQFKEWVATHKNGRKIQEKFFYLQFVDFYLTGDLFAAKELYEKLYAEQKEKPSTDKLNAVSITFTLAVCCYHCGDYTKAAELFNEVASTAPSLHYAKLAGRYLDAMEQQIAYVPEPISHGFDASAIPTPKSGKIGTVILSTLLLVGSVLLVMSTMEPKQPMHFKGLDYYSTKSDVHSLYGQPDEVREYDSFKGQYYDVYNVEYLGVKATLQFTYYFDSDILHSSWFTIDSTQFSSYDEYKVAVDRTYEHFAKTLKKYRVEDESDEYGKNITWYNDKGGYSYRMFETELTFSKEENDIRECTVIEFCKYIE